MEKPHEQEAFEQEQNEKATRLDVSKLSPEDQQRGIDANLKAMVDQFVGRLVVLEELLKREIDVKVNAKMVDGRRVHFRITRK